MTEATTVPQIVVGVDGSESSQAALRWAVDQAKPIRARVDAVIAWEVPPAWTGLAPPMDEAPAELAARAREALDRAVDDALGPGPGRPVDLRRVAGRGHPATVLLEAAVGADLLVVGNRGHGGFSQALLGSVGQHCVQHAPCPVVVVRGVRRGPGRLDAGRRRPPRTAAVRDRPG